MIEESFKVRYYEMDGRAIVPPWVLQNYFQEAAGLDAHNLAFGWEELAPQGVAWVLTKVQLKFFKAIKGASEIKIKTWHHLAEKIQCRRDFIIYDADGSIAAKGISWWLIINVETRKILRAPQQLIEMNPNNPPAVMQPGDFKAPSFDGAEPVTAVPVTARLEDIDYNGHVNNVHFMAWALAGVPAEVYEARQLDDLVINFKAELRRGDEVVVNTYAAGQSAYWHILKRPADGKDIAAVYTSWR